MPLLRLEPDFVSKYWDEFLPMINASLPATEDSQRDARLLSAVMSGVLTCWAYNDEDEGLIMFGTTTFAADTIDGERNLLIYTIFSNGKVNMGQWKQAFVRLREFAEGKGCKAIIAYSNVSRVVKLVEQLGGDSSTRVLRLEV